MTGRQRSSAAQAGVRIIGGRWRRRRFRLPDGTDVRPTPDRVRETVFNWLAPYLEGAGCLDLFAGSGILGFEALSRGAASAVLVEREAALVAHLERCRDELAAPARIVRADAASYLQRPDIGQFDIVFLDPPYTMPLEPLLALLDPVLRAGGFVYVERPATQSLPSVVPLETYRRSRAGQVLFGLERRTRPDGAH